jgi:hypothetical protein
MSQIVQVVSMLEVPMRLGSASFQSNEVSGAQNSLSRCCAAPAPAQSAPRDSISSSSSSSSPAAMGQRRRNDGQHAARQESPDVERTLFSMHLQVVEPSSLVSHRRR